MRIRITEEGLVGWDGSLIDKGTKLTVNGLVPGGWAGKYEVLADEPAKEAVPIVNPDVDLDDITPLRDEYEKLTGETADKRWKEDRLKAEIKKAAK